MSKKQLVNAADNNLFWLEDGRSLRNLVELDHVLRNMNMDFFSKYVNKEKNDFAVWIAEILKDPELARKIKRYKAVEPVSKIVNAHIKKNYIL